MLLGKTLWLCGIAVTLSSGVGAFGAEAEKNDRIGKTANSPAAESPAPATEEPKPVSRILPLPTSVDSRLGKRLEEFLRVYGKASVDRDRSLVFVQCQPRHLPQVESLIAEFDWGAQSGYLLRLVWLQDDLENGGPVPADLQPVVDRLKNLGLGEVGKVGQLLLRVANGVEFNATAYPQLHLDSAHLSFQGRVAARTADSVEVSISVQASVATPTRAGRRGGGSGSNNVANVKTTAKLKVGTPAIVSVTPYGAGSVVFVLEAITAP